MVPNFKPFFCNFFKGVANSFTLSGLNDFFFFPLFYWINTH